MPGLFLSAISDVDQLGIGRRITAVIAEQGAVRVARAIGKVLAQADGVRRTWCDAGWRERIAVLIPVLYDTFKANRAAALSLCERTAAGERKHGERDDGFHVLSPITGK